MKTTYIFIVFLLNVFGITFSQEKAIYIENLNDFKIELSNDGKTILQSYLFIKNDNGFDSYYFLINTYFKDFNESQILLENKEYIILDKNEYSKMNSCEIHNYFSENNNIFLVYKKDNKYYGWEIIYEGTSRNIIKSIQKGRI